MQEGVLFKFRRVTRYIRVYGILRTIIHNKKSVSYVKY